jgi:hypothetical protein
LAKDEATPNQAPHPIELFARAYGIMVNGTATAGR